MLYPLSYGGGAGPKPGAKPGWRDQAVESTGAVGGGPAGSSPTADSVLPTAPQFPQDLVERHRVPSGDLLLGATQVGHGLRVGKDLQGLAEAVEQLDACLDDLRGHHV
jgi:hypothetical protein